MDNTLLFLFCACLIIIGQSFTIWGAFVTIPYKNLTMWQAYKMAIPFAWINWIFLTNAINISHKYSLLTQTQVFFLIITVQFIATIFISKFYLDKPIYRSDYIGIVVLIMAYCISMFHMVSKFLRIPIPIAVPVSISKKTTLVKEVEHDDVGL